MTRPGPQLEGRQRCGGSQRHHHARRSWPSPGALRSPAAYGRARPWEACARRVPGGPLPSVRWWLPCVFDRRRAPGRSVEPGGGRRCRQDMGSHGPLRGPRGLPSLCVHVLAADGSAQVPMVLGPLARAGGTYTRCRVRSDTPRPRVRRSAPPGGPRSSPESSMRRKLGRVGVSARLTSSSQDGQASLGTRIV